MMSKKTAALAALLTVGVVDGGARVVAKGHAPLVLAKNDRTMVAPKLPPLTTRAAKPATATTKTRTPAPAPARQSRRARRAHRRRRRRRSSTKDEFRTAVQSDHLDEIKFCYEQALADQPGPWRRFTVQHARS